MVTIAVADLQSGVVLEEPVYTPRGVLLAAAGTVLAEAHLATFNSWGVVEVCIVGEQEEESETTAPIVDEEQALTVQRIVEDRFALVVPQYPFMREMQRVTELILLRRVDRDTVEGR